jgi:hypothetical protein
MKNNGIGNFTNSLFNSKTISKYIKDMAFEIPANVCNIRTNLRNFVHNLLYTFRAGSDKL